MQSLKSGDPPGRGSTLGAAGAHASTLPSAQGPPARGERNRRVLVELSGPEPGAVFSLLHPGGTIGRGRGADVLLDDTTVSSQHARFSVSGGVILLEDLSSRNGTFVNGLRIRERTPLHDGDLVSFGGSTTVKFSMVDAGEESAHRSLFEVTLRDPLTRLYNRRYFDERLVAEFAFARRQRSQLALLLIDVDHFKRLNDNFGHQYGDVVLKLVASSAQKMMRPSDVLARYGGDEMVILARATSLRNAQILGDRLCRQVSSLELNLPGREVTVSISVGVACISSELSSRSPEAFLGSADLALFEAKKAGRNRAAVAPPDR